MCLSNRLILIDSTEEKNSAISYMTYSGLCLVLHAYKALSIFVCVQNIT